MITGALLCGFLIGGMFAVGVRTFLDAVKS
jgi:hypothetical protein